MGKSADQVAAARRERKAAQAGGKKVVKKEKGSGSESEAEENENKKSGRSMKVADLGAPREMSRREKCVVVLPASSGWELTSACREQADKKAAAERYAKLHAAGKVRPLPFSFRGPV